MKTWLKVLLGMVTGLIVAAIAFYFFLRSVMKGLPF